MIRSNRFRAVPFAVVAVALCAAAMVVVVPHAQAKPAAPAKNLVCTKCVGATDIATGAVTNPKLGKKSVSTDKLNFDPATQAELDAAIASLSGTVSSLAATVAALRAEFDAARASLQASVDSLTARVDAIEGQLTTGGHNRLTLAPLGTLSANAIAVPHDGRPVVSWRDGGGIKLVRCVDVECSAVGATQTIAAGAANAGSLTVGHDGAVLIAYVSAGSVQLARCSNAACSSSTTKTLSGTTGATGIPQVLMRSTRLPIIVYTNAGGLQFIKCNESDCNSVAGGGSLLASVPTSFAAALDGSGTPVVTSTVAGAVTATVCTDTSCTGNNDYTYTNPANTRTLLGHAATAPNGLPTFAVMNSQNTAAEFGGCTTVGCTLPAVSAIGFSVETNVAPAVTYSHGFPTAFFVRGSDHVLFAARCTAIGCAGGSAYSNIPHTTLNVSSGTISAETGIDDLPLVVAPGDAGIELVHCSAPSCVAYTR